MRIAVFHSLASGGAKRTLYEQVKRLSAGNDIDLFTITGADDRYLPLKGIVKNRYEFKFEEAWPPKPLFLLNPVYSLLRLVRMENVCSDIAKAINAGKYDIAYVTHGLPGPAPSLLSRLKIPSVYYCQEPPRRFYEAEFTRRTNSGFSFAALIRKASYAPYEYFYKRSDRKSIGFATCVLVNSLYSQKRVMDIYGIEAKVLYHGVDADRFSPLDVSKENAVISVGALHSSKGHDFVIESLGLLKDKPKLFIVADREYEGEKVFLLNLARQKGVEVEIFQGIDDEKLCLLYNTARACACGQINEPFGLVPLEAMACGLPVVAVDEGGLAESIIPGETGLLTERNREQFSSSIAKLLRDQELAKRLGNAGRKQAQENWPWDKSAAELKKILWNYL
ncbi:MAG: glycosyltransferase family 4 protein [Candidatus Omnitrophica bacterium]|nr:glycosyltransferase family 4 protein [Candidatus Omnitrophota bacterium]